MSEKLNVIFVSNLCSERVTEEMIYSKIGFPNLAAQKFHRLLAQGMALNKELFNISVLSVPEYHSNSKKAKLVNVKSEIEKEVHYKYVPIFLIPFVKRVVIIIYLFINIITWRLKSKHKKNLIVFDILNLSTSIVSLFLSKVLRIKSVAIVTDLPSLMYVLQDKISFSDRYTIRIQNEMLSLSDGYVFLTEAMNKIINQKGQPYCIIEGLADIQLLSLKNIDKSSAVLKIFHYSGGLFEQFGVKALIDAFMLITRKDVRLHLFGNGELIEYINECIKKDSRIVFFGYRQNKDVLEDQLNAIVLLNPRFTHEEFTKYSFPSKTIEYMASGIPLLTTKLPGIPKEYFDYVYVFENETVEGYQIAMEGILNRSISELTTKGENAKKFVLSNKNNKIQAEKFYNNFKSFISQ